MRVTTLERIFDMLGWALLFFLVAIVAAVFGFGGIAIAAAGIAKSLFFVFLVLFLASLIFHLVSGGRQVPPPPV
jgi:uncharacterized membrane protein YtjA (UPF0391 family)